MKKSFYLSGLLFFCFVLCSAVVRATVPVIGTNPVNDTVCSGSQARFIFAATGTAPITFTWLVSTDGGTTWSLVGAVAPYSGATNDTLKIATSNALNGYKYKGIATNVSGADTSTAATLTVDTLYTVINGASALCVGQTITLSDAATGGSWVSVHVDTATVNAGSGVVTGVRAGKDTILYISTNICGTDTAKKAITVNAIPSAGTITGASILCKFSSTTLSDAIPGGTWSSSTPSISSVGSGGYVYGLSQGNGIIDYTVSNGSCSTTAAFNIRVDTTVTAMPITGPTATCVGNSVILMNVNVIGTGVWSTSNTNATVSPSGMVTGVAGGTDIITYAFTNACNSVTTTVSEEIDAPLGPTVISGPASVCLGSWVVLSESAGGGVWISSNPAIANVNSIGEVTGLSQGLAIISYYLSNACGASIATYSVTVLTPASAITGGDSVGVGAMLTLGNSAAGGTWSIANTGIANINNTTGVVSGVATGTTTVTYVVTDACGTSSTNLTLYVGVTASAGIIGIDSVCIGHSITLSDSVASGVWSASNGNATVTASGGVVSGVTTGLDTLIYTVHNGFGTSMVTKIIYVNHLSAISLYGPNILALGGNYSIYGYPQGGTFTYSSSTLGDVIGVFNGTYTLIHALTGLDSVTINVTYLSFVDTSYGTDVITYHVTNSCGTSDSSFTLSLLQPNGVNTLNNNTASMHVYPNPNNGEFTVNLSSGIAEDAVVTVTNIVGEKVKELTISTNQPTSIILDQPAGMYFLSAATATGRYTAKITISK